ncbi:SOS response-associated peptidase family protein [Alteriqipengyuania flavescens]|uniref:SOS response-associated peptidase family protein n=1 Tax=Alteriqipengyuania flavescens TaxID=3053610 RepID=UPI0025B2967A|nr:SOS response-associated peptidase family protein [Alteriqipengyuania flavescens]WJY17712.1 SOS response-associated peptidase family protein [Alteriqipengyuania flavescens]WJY23655.1 SOS response-associated peptidase family protein [Alteriqipengyuania flavescens]
MTVLFRLDAMAADVAVRFATRAGDDPWAGGHVAPGSFAPVVTSGREFVAGPRPASEPPRRVVPRLWGVPPPPGVPHDGRSGVLTVRNPDSPFWIGNLRNSEFRCLVPATSIMAWGRADPASGRRRQHWLGCGDQTIFALAGVWVNSEVPAFALLTCPANAAWKAIGQERMPVILPPHEGAAHIWLRAEWRRAESLIAPYPSSMIREAGGR